MVNICNVNTRRGVFNVDGNKIEFPLIMMIAIIPIINFTQSKHTHTMYQKEKKIKVNLPVFPMFLVTAISISGIV